MSAKRDRIGTVLRVRRVQELEAAGGLARAGAAAREAERVLGALHAHYDRHRSIDAEHGRVPQRVRDHEVRSLQAQSIQRARAQVQANLAAVEDHRRLLMARTQAVRAMERLDERARTEEEAERLRRERAELDEQATSRAAAAEAREVRP